MLDGIGFFDDTQKWFAGFSEVLEAVVARSFVAASVIAEGQSNWSWHLVQDLLRLPTAA